MPDKDADQENIENASVDSDAPADKPVERSGASVGTRLQNPNLQNTMAATPERRKAQRTGPGGGIFGKFCEDKNENRDEALVGTKTPRNTHVNIHGRKTPFNILAHTPGGKNPETIAAETGGEERHKRLAGEGVTLFSKKKPSEAETQLPEGVELKTLHIKTTITKEVIEFMAHHSDYNKKQRHPSNLQLFHKSADTLAEDANLESHGTKHHCHAVGFSLGGDKAHEIIEANSKNPRKHTLKKTPQNRKNIFVGSESMNGMMIVVEQLIRNKLLDGTVDKFELDLKLDYWQPFADEGDDVMFGHRLDYGIKSYKDEQFVHEDVFKFNPLSEIKPILSMPRRLQEAFDRIVQENQAEDQTPPSRP